MHHLCYEVDDHHCRARPSAPRRLPAWLGDGERESARMTSTVLFLHPKDFCGTLIELEQA